MGLPTSIHESGSTKPIGRARAAGGSGFLLRVGPSLPGDDSPPAAATQAAATALQHSPKVLPTTRSRLQALTSFGGGMVGPNRPGPRQSIHTVPMGYTHQPWTTCEATSGVILSARSNANRLRWETGIGKRGGFWAARPANRVRWAGTCRKPGSNRLDRRPAPKKRVCSLGAIPGRSSCDT